MHIVLSWQGGVNLFYSNRKPVQSRTLLQTGMTSRMNWAAHLHVCGRCQLLTGPLSSSSLMLEEMRLAYFTWKESESSSLQGFLRICSELPTMSFLPYFILLFTIVTIIIIIILAMLGLCCCPPTFSICSKWGLLSCCGARDLGQEGSVVVPATFYWSQQVIRSVQTQRVEKLFPLFNRKKCKGILEKGR